MWMQADLAGRFGERRALQRDLAPRAGRRDDGQGGLPAARRSRPRPRARRRAPAHPGGRHRLRGYDPTVFDGTSRVVANVEWRRRLTGEFLHVAVLGLTAFVDGGKTWGARVGPSTEGWRGDVGRRSAAGDHPRLRRPDRPPGSRSPRIAAGSGVPDHQPVAVLSRRATAPGRPGPETVRRRASGRPASAAGQPARRPARRPRSGRGPASRFPSRPSTSSRRRASGRALYSVGFLLSAWASGAPSFFIIGHSISPFMPCM